MFLGLNTLRVLQVVCPTPLIQAIWVKVCPHVQRQASLQSCNGLIFSATVFSVSLFSAVLSCCRSFGLGLSWGHPSLVGPTAVSSWQRRGPVTRPQSASCPLSIAKTTLSVIMVSVYKKKKKNCGVARRRKWMFVAADWGSQTNISGTGQVSSATHTQTHYQQYRDTHTSATFLLLQDAASTQPWHATHRTTVEITLMRGAVSTPALCVQRREWPPGLTWRVTGKLKLKRSSYQF